MGEILTSNIRRAKNIIFKEINFFRSRPLEANWEISHRCNLRCLMCGVWKKKKTENFPPELNKEECFRAIDDLKALKVRIITLTGGEPFIREDIEPVIKYIKGKNINCGVFTNATLIDQSCASFLVTNKVDNVYVSIDGYETAHDEIRGIEGAFEKAKRGILNIIEMKKKLKSNLPVIDLHMTLSDLNVDSLDKLEVFAKELGIRFSFQPFSETQKDVIDATVLDGEKIGSDRYLVHNRSLHFKKQNITVLKRKLKKLDSNIFSKMISAIGDSYLESGRFPIKKCYVTSDYIFIDPYGNVFPCTNLDKYILGNVREESIKNIWNNERHLRIKKILSKRKFPVCDYCCHLGHNLTPTQILKILFKRI